MTPREPDRFDAQAREMLDVLSRAQWSEKDLINAVADRLRAAEASALERAAQGFDELASMSVDLDSDAAARQIRALIPPAAAPAACTCRYLSGTRFENPGNCPVHPDVPAAAPAAETGKGPAPDLRALVVEALDIQDDCDHPPACECPWCSWAWRAAKAIASRRGVPVAVPAPAQGAEAYRTENLQASLAAAGKRIAELEAKYASAEAQVTELLAMIEHPRVRPIVDDIAAARAAPTEGEGK